MLRCCRIVGSMNRMPFEAHRKPNDTIHSRMVRLSRSGARSSSTVTCGSTPTSGLTSGIGLTSAIANRFRHVAAHEEQQRRRDDADDEQRPPAEIRDDGEALYGSARAFAWNLPAYPSGEWPLNPFAW